MNDQLRNSEDSTSKPPVDPQASVCEQCGKNPCVCKNDETHQKPRTKGSHRTGEAPKLKWL